MSDWSLAYSFICSKAALVGVTDSGGGSGGGGSVTDKSSVHFTLLIKILPSR